MRLAINSKQTLVASVALHGLLFGALTWTPRSPLPRGVGRAGDAEVVEVGLVGHRAVASAPEAGRAKKRAPAAAPKPVEGHAEAVQTGFADGAQTPGPLGVADGVEASRKERYLYELRVLLEGRKIYPKVSRYMNESGRVIVRFVIQNDGRIESVEVVRPSAFERLNAAAHQLVAGLTRYKPLPTADASMSVELPIEYLLR